MEEAMRARWSDAVGAACAVMLSVATVAIMALGVIDLVGRVAC